MTAAVNSNRHTQRNEFRATHECYFPSYVCGSVRFFSVRLQPPPNHGLDDSHCGSNDKISVPRLNHPVAVNHSSSCDQ